MTDDLIDLVDLASERLGGAVVAANDEFFAPKENLLKREAPIWVDGRYTGSLYVAAALVFAAKLAGHGDDSAAIITYTPTSDRDDAPGAVLDAFAFDMAPSLSRTLEQARLQQ